ncbi:hypothetical protein [Bdellovibrio sp. HCB209]|uniref:hypothetical protein n=1 Tax=Bdellovibrio sp. HCB209 TaxID=3394354 RepID=UPI0039B5E485
MSNKSLKITILGSILAAGCSHTSPTKDLLTPDFLLQKDVKQITFQGDNERPRFSANGTRLIYVSRGRPSQKNAQVFETDLIRNKERRVTFQDGDAFDPSYVSDMEIIYSSTTDEIKESPFLNKNPNKEFPPSEIYVSDRFGAEILRITNQPGYDGESYLISHPTKPSVVFTSRRGEVTGIFRMDLKSSFVSLVAAETGKDRRSPALTADNSRLAYIETDLKTKVQSLHLLDFKTKHTVELKGGEGEYRDLFFAPRSPARLFYSVLRKGEKKHHIEVYDLETKCTQLVFKGADSLMFPVVSNDTKERLAFTRNFQDKKQIYTVDLPTDLGACIPEPVTNKPKTETPVVATPQIPAAESTAAVTPAPTVKPTPKRKRKAAPVAPTPTPAVTAPAETPTTTESSKAAPVVAEPTTAPSPTTTPSATPKPVETPSPTPSVTPSASPVSTETATPAPTPVK